MQRREHQLPGRGRGQRQPHRLGVAHLTDHDHVRILTQRSAQCAPEGRRVPADLAVRDDGLLIRVTELDGVLDRENVFALVAVDVIEQCRERRGLAGSRRPRHHHQPALQFGELEHLHRQAEFLDTEDPARQHPDGRGEPHVMVEHIAADPQRAGHFIREVDIVIALEAGTRIGIHDLAEHQLNQFLRYHLAGERFDLSVDAQHRRAAGTDVEIRGAMLMNDFEQRVDTGHDPSKAPWVSAGMRRVLRMACGRRFLEGYRQLVAPSPASRAICASILGGACR